MRKLIVAPFAALRQYVSREFWFTLTLLVERHGWHWYETNAVPPAPGTLPDALRNAFGRLPDVVLFWESYAHFARQWSALDAAGVRVDLMLDDIHGWQHGMPEALRDARKILAAYQPRFAHFYPHVEPSRVFWVPHAAGPDFLLPVRDDPAPVVFVSGAMNEHYPLRLVMLDLARRRPELALLQVHPGYHFAFDHERDPRVGRAYAETIRGCLAGFTDALRYEYIVAKHFEIPAAGALLIADRAVAPQLAMLGFIDGEHYLSASADDLEATVANALHPRNFPAVDAIRRRGHALVHERHTCADRARLIDSICV
jgi:hypothetical protein